MTQVRVILSLLLATFIIHTATTATHGEQEAPVPTEIQENQEPTHPVENGHHRSKRSPYDPLIPALLLGKSAFLLGTVLGPKLFYHPYPHRHRGGYRSFGHGGHGHHGGGGYGHGGGHGGGGYGHGGGHGGYGRGWGWK